MSSFIPTYNTAYTDKVGKTTFQEATRQVSIQLP
jgi:hypothetical protein